MAKEDVLIGIKHLLENIDLTPILPVHFKKGIYSDWKDTEDAINYFCALDNKTEAIITRNVKDFKKSEIPVYSPADFLQKFGN